MARAIFAAGHMLPAFALLITASGVGLLVAGHPPKIAFWLPSIGTGMYLAGTQTLIRARTKGMRLLRVGLTVATFLLGVLHWALGPRTYLWGWPAGSWAARPWPPGVLPSTRTAAQMVVGEQTAAPRPSPPADEPLRPES
jgi:hypothetical protein